jgi:hypothetical protein
LEAHPRTLKSVFRSDVRLTVPLFQRPYVWNADEQWEPLWEDVIATRERVEHGDPVPHFLGAIVLEQKRGSLGSLEVREVIDGQQRLTTLQLLIAAVRDGFLDHAAEGRTIRRLSKLLENDPDLVDEPDEQHKLWPTNRDRDAYRDVMRGAYREASFSPKLPRIAGAYTWFRTAIDELLGDRSEQEVTALLGGLGEVLLEHLELVVIDLGENDNAQVIFETLNARGTALRASDLIKNLLFRTLQDAGRPVEQLYKASWEHLEGEPWQVDVRQGRLSRPRLDAFMGHFLVVLLQREVQSHQLFPATRAHVHGDPNRAEDFLREASRYAEVYDRLDSGRCDDPAEAASLARMQIVDTQTMTPLLLWLFANTAGPERRDALLALESYVVRRSLCRLTTKNYNRLFLELLRRLGAGEGRADELVPRYLAQQGSESGMWPTDEELRRSLTQLPLYRLLKREALQRTLLALDAHATTARTEPLVPNRKLSVEHLLPQQWETNWPLPDDEDSAEREWQEREELLHTLGNLTLVTASLNSTLSNAAWTIKRGHLLQHSALTLNRSLPEQWDLDGIRARAAWLAELAVDLWTRPAPGDGPVFAAESDRDLRPDRDTAQAAAGVAGRRDIGRHIEHVFSSVAPGEFLTVAEIRRRPSPEYPDNPPSGGAITARLFPAGRTTTVPGVRPEVRAGVRGASRSG